MKNIITDWKKTRDTRCRVIYYRMDITDQFNGQVASVVEDSDKKTWLASSVVKSNKYGKTIFKTATGAKFKSYDYNHAQSLLEGLFWCDLNLIEVGFKINFPFEYGNVLSDDF